MKNLIFVFVFFNSYILQAQYAPINAMIEQLEEIKYSTKNLKNENLEDRKFVLIKDFADHTERNVLVIKGNSANFIEIFDDKSTGKSSSNVFYGDVVKTQNNILSFRFDKLENEKIALPLTKAMMLVKKKKNLYLLDINTKEEWMAESNR